MICKGAYWRIFDVDKVPRGYERVGAPHPEGKIWARTPTGCGRMILYPQSYEETPIGGMMVGVFCQTCREEFSETRGPRPRIVSGGAYSGKRQR